NALDAHDHAVVRLLDLEPEHGPVGARRERVPQHILIPDLAVDSAPNARRDGDGRAERLARHRLRLPAALAPDQPAVFEVEDVHRRVAGRGDHVTPERVTVRDLDLHPEPVCQVVPPESEREIDLRRLVGTSDFARRGRRREGIPRARRQDDQGERCGRCSAPARARVRSGPHPPRRPVLRTGCSGAGHGTSLLSRGSRKRTPRRARSAPSAGARPAPRAQKLALMSGSQRNDGELLAAWLSSPIWMPRSTCALLKTPTLMPRWVPRTSL